ncbi:hypothetical protein [Aureibacillus halotolerans]|uniref:Uncharacterized protein n=1 Tax=Aureibacillus halotolerans TaxID=1508390 RepID=A0A4R6TUR4_9BACI|nr:hypothetical protein [Aureibacillus halotolerans]TDQ37131.1 hypothetical protein EV213_11410 [Aureibacillus halotolerans]
MLKKRLGARGEEMQCSNGSVVREKRTLVLGNPVGVRGNRLGARENGGRVLERKWSARKTYIGARKLGWSARK